MKVVFRVDSSVSIGTGHLMRCLGLARALKERGVQVIFNCRALPGNLISKLCEEGFETNTLAYPGFGNLTSENGNQPWSSPDEYSSWLGVELEEEINEFREILALESLKSTIDWLVVDHYSLGQKWEQEMRAFVQKIFVIDDLANRVHDCDVLLDQNFYLETKHRYSGKVPESCRLLLGPSYALLRAEFKEVRSKLRKRDGTIRRLLVFFGGSDPTNATMKALEAVRPFLNDGLCVDVVLGASNPRVPEILERLHQVPGVACHVNTQRMAELMNACDLFLGAGGSTAWERCCLGLPSVVLAVANNQIDISNELAKAGGCFYLGIFDEIAVEDLRKHLEFLFNSKNLLNSCSLKGYSLVDGLGLDRAQEVFFPKKSYQL